MADLVLPVIEKRQQTADVMSIRFGIKRTDFSYTAGQFLRVTLDGVADPRGPSRFFSFASSPTEKGFIAVATKISQSPFKQKLATLREGDAIPMQGPFGRFTLVDDVNKQHIFLGGGIGITPFRSMLRYATDKKLPHRITLLYSNQTPEDIVFKEDLEKIAAENPNITIVNTITRPPDQSTTNNITMQQFNNNALWKWEKGRINEDMVKKYAQDLASAIFYVCGPPSMAEALRGLVKDMGVSEDNIKVERFTGYP